MLTPTEGKIIVKPESEESVRTSGIVIAKTEKKRQRTGYVTAMGENLYNINHVRDDEMKVGDRVIFDMYGPHEITHDGEELLIIDTYNTGVHAIISGDAEVSVHGEE